MGKFAAYLNAGLAVAWLALRAWRVPARLLGARHVQRRHVRVRAAVDGRRLLGAAVPEQLLERRHVQERRVLLPAGVHRRRVPDARVRAEVGALRRAGHSRQQRRRYYLRYYIRG